MMSPEQFAPLVLAELQGLGANQTYDETLTLLASGWHWRLVENGALAAAKLLVECGVVSTMTPGEWLTSCDPKATLARIRYQHKNRELGLFGCACCRRIWELIPNDLCRRLVEATELYYEKRIDKPMWQEAAEAAVPTCNALVRAHDATRQADRMQAIWPLPGMQRRQLLDLFFEEPGYYRAANASLKAAYAQARSCEGPAFEAERTAQAGLLRVLMGDNCLGR